MRSSSSTPAIAQKYPESSGGYRHEIASPQPNQTLSYMKVLLALQNRQNTSPMVHPDTTDLVW